ALTACGRQGRFLSAARTGSMFATRTGYERVPPAGRFACCAGGSERVSFAQQRGSFIPPAAGDRAGPVGAGPAPAPWASASARYAGPFALAGFLTDRLDSPSMAHASFFAASLPLVLKSFLRSAAAMAPTTPLQVLFFFANSFIAECMKSASDNAVINE
ncbi:hypothetical protein, partial [Pantoea latae]|uniref:hypothetical protein n=1 Tax=Pantoea latae TaxID=1964541 RepID=UPI001F1B89D7